MNSELKRLEQVNQELATSPNLSRRELLDMKVIQESQELVN
ncbi:MAG: hypothetical protein WBA93_10460 [Microcoleaceae cyanobacterium]